VVELHTSSAPVGSQPGPDRIRRRRQEDTLAGLDQLQELRRLLDAEIGCTRKVTDEGWMPHARQIGMTGRSVSPRLYVAIGTSGSSTTWRACGRRERCSR
jgi:hypothetical protein